MSFNRTIFCWIYFLVLPLATGLHGHGIGGDTLVGVYSDNRHMQQIYEMVQHDEAYVCSYNFDSKKISFERVKQSREHKTNCYLRIGFDNHISNDILCTPTQEFYVFGKKQWIPAYQLNIGDELLTSRSDVISITRLQFVEESLIVYALEVENTHNFCVSRFAVLTHNILIPAASIGLSVAFGSGAAAGATAGSFFGPVTLIGGFTLGGLIALGVKAYRDQQKDVNYNLEFNTTSLNAFFHKQDIHLTDKDGAQAPGMPTKEVGYEKPKKWDGKKVKHPHTGQVGYPDSAGNIWVPTGPGSKAHGGPHWDVVPPGKKKPHLNVYPNGKIR